MHLASTVFVLFTLQTKTPQEFLDTEKKKADAAAAYRSSLQTQEAQPAVGKAKLPKVLDAAKARACLPPGAVLWEAVKPLKLVFLVVTF